MYFLSFFILLGLGLSTTVFGANENFIPLVGLPYVGDNGGPSNFGDYVKALYYAAISIGAFLAVIKIIFAGVKYMLTDVVTTKGDAKKDIQGALLGLLIVVGAVLILQTINPRLLEINLFSNAPVPHIGTEERTITGKDTCNITTGCSDKLPACEPDEKIVPSFDSTGHITYSCIKNINPPIVLKPGEFTKIFDYECSSVTNPDGCFLPFHYQNGKGDAEAKCQDLNGYLDDDPTTLGKGICYYTEE